MNARERFFHDLVQAAENDERIWLLVGDLGYGYIEEFAEKFPERFVNCGVAEQNMIGVAAGLALSGKHPVVYSIGAFPTLRCLEQIRNDVSHHGLPVTIVSVSGYKKLGPSHDCSEVKDIVGRYLAITEPTFPLPEFPAYIELVA